MAARDPCQVTTQDVDCQRRCQQDCANPEAPVTMHPSPVRTGIGFAGAVAVSLRVVLVSCQFVSIAGEYSPRRAAWLQRAR